MATRLLLVTPAGSDRTAFREFLESSGYHVVETSGPAAADADTGAFRPDLVLLDHEADADARLALRSAVDPGTGLAAPPVVELCLTLPTSFQAATSVLDRLAHGRYGSRR